MNNKTAINILREKYNELEYSMERAGIDNEKELRKALPEIIKLIEKLEMNNKIDRYQIINEPFGISIWDTKENNWVIRWLKK